MTIRKPFQYVRKALSRNKDYPALRALNVRDTILIANDGFRLHITKRQPGDDATIFSLAKEAHIPVIDEGDPYPNVERAVNHLHQTDPIVEIMFNVKFLRDALTGFADKTPVKLTLRGATRPLEIKTEDTYALIMPLSEIAGSTYDFFEPFPEEEESEN